MPPYLVELCKYNNSYSDIQLAWNTENIENISICKKEEADLSLALCKSLHKVESYVFDRNLSLAAVPCKNRLTLAN